MEMDSVLFNYYSMPEFPENCYLKFNPNIAYRNMLMFPCTSDNRIHFEFPVFEDHSYNTICNRFPLRNLIKRPSGNDKYIILRTMNRTLKKNYIIGFYRIGKEFYYESKMWDNNGYVWGIESNEVHLLNKTELEYVGPRIPRTPPSSWSKNKKWEHLLTGLISDITSRKDYAALYQSETKRLVDLFKDPRKILEWRNYCSKCNYKKCTFFNQSRRYHKKNPTDLIEVIHHAYTCNVYSRNELLKLDKIYLQ